jgi:ribonuclease P protein component
MAGRIHTLRSRREFKELYTEARAYHGEYLVLLVYRVEGTPGKSAFVASRRVGGAVRRNRARRVLKEAFRTLGVDLSAEGANIAMLARPMCARVKMTRVRAEMEKLLVAAGLLRRQDASGVEDGAPAPNSRKRE